MKPLQKIQTNNAPQAIGPYSQAIVLETLLFVSGQIPLDPQTGKVVEGGIVEETKQVLKNMTAILNEQNIGLERVVKTEVFLKDMDDFKKMNAVYADFFTADPKPARQAVQVAKLPLDVRVEISCIASLE